MRIFDEPDKTNRWLSCVGLFISMMFLALNTKATVVELPGGIFLEVPGNYVLPATESDFLKVSQNTEDQTIYVKPSKRFAGLGWMKLATLTDKPLAKDASGHLDVYLVHVRGYQSNEDGLLKINGIKDGVNEKLTIEQDEKSCQHSSCDTRTDERIWVFISNHNLPDSPSSVLAPGTEIRRFTYHNVPYSALMLKKPLISFDDHVCSLGSPAGNTHCRDLQAVILRFIPDDSSMPSELAVHVLNPEKVAKGEAVLGNVAEIFSEQGKPVWQAVFNQLSPYSSNVTSDGVEQGFPSYEQLPVMPEPEEVLLARQQRMAYLEEGVWNQGTCSGTIYCGDKHIYENQVRAFGLQAAANAMQVDMAASATKMQAEIVAMTRDLHGGGNLEVWDDDILIDQPSGYITQGGSFSNFAAMDAFVTSAREKGVRRPVVIVADTVHPSITKAAKKLQFELEVVPTSWETKTIPVDEVRRLIKKYNDPTIATWQDEDNPAPAQKHVIGIVASAPNYSYGITDSIQELSDLVVESRRTNPILYLHVDSCMGGFIYPFAKSMKDWLNTAGCKNLKERLGDEAAECPEMDFPEPLFKYEGVSSVSADVHKYGYSLKGVSVIMFRSQELLSKQFFVDGNWDGGAVMSYGLAGSSSAGLVSAAHYVMTSLGLVGYMTKVAKIMVTAMNFQNIIRAHSDDLEIIGKPGMCFAFKARDPEKLNIFHIADVMKKENPKWRYNHLQRPDALHFCITGPQTWGGGDTAIADEDLMEKSVGEGLVSALEGEQDGNSRTGSALIGMTELLNPKLDSLLSDATRRFEISLRNAVAQAKTMIGQRAQSGTMYGLGAAGIVIKDPLIREKLMVAGAFALLQTQRKEFGVTHASTRYWVNRMVKEEMHWPAY